MSVVLSFERITRKWASLRRFAGYTVDSAIDAIKEGHIDVASFFSKLILFLPFASRSLEKVLQYTLVKASHGFINKDGKLYEISVDEVPGFDPDERDKVKSAFESMHELGLADVVSPERVKLRLDIVNDLVRHIAPYIAENVSLKDVGEDVVPYPLKVISGISSLYVMQKSGRLPSSYTVMMGLLSPLAEVRKDGSVVTYTTIDLSKWNTARRQMSSLRPLKDKFDVEYLKAIGVLYENRIIVRSYPMEVSGTIVEKVIKPTYHRYYTMIRERRAERGRRWAK